MDACHLPLLLTWHTSPFKTVIPTVALGDLGTLVSNNPGEWRCWLPLQQRASFGTVAHRMGSTESSQNEAHASVGRVDRADQNGPNPFPEGWFYGWGVTRVLGKSHPAFPYHDWLKDELNWSNQRKSKSFNYWVKENLLVGAVNGR